MLAAIERGVSHGLVGRLGVGGLSASQLEELFESEGLLDSGLVQGRLWGPLLAGNQSIDRQVDSLGHQLNIYNQSKSRRSPSESFSRRILQIE